MVRNLGKIVFAAALVMATAPAFAQDMQLPLVGNVDLDPFHIFTPAAAPAPAPMMKKHGMMHHKMMMHHHHHKMMMHHKKMMKKM
jgi:hypothetical protein